MLVERSNGAIQFGMKISIPNLYLVVLLGPSGSGKSTFARKHFLPTGILSSDACRALVSVATRILAGCCNFHPG
jgi:ABC-type sulfate/molybdate transport systems ATPase subunit